MSRLNRHIRNILVALCCLLLVGMLLLNAPFVQHRTAKLLSSAIEEHTKAHVDLTGLRWRLPSDVVVDSLRIDDHEGRPMFAADRVAVKIKWTTLLHKGEVDIRNVRLFHPVVHLVADSLGAPVNAEFLFDMFNTDDDEGGIGTVRVNSLIVRHATCSYDVLSEPTTPDCFNPSHVSISDLNAHLSLKILSPDSLNLNMRELMLHEQSGIELNDMQLRICANHRRMLLSDFALEMPHTSLHLDTLNINYMLPSFEESLADTTLLSSLKINDILSSLSYWGALTPSVFTPSDLAAFVPELLPLDESLTLCADFAGDKQHVSIPKLELRTLHRDVDVCLQGTSEMSDVHFSRLNADLQRCNVSSQGWQTVVDLLVAADTLCGTSLAPSVRLWAERLGNSSLNGSIDFSTKEAAASLAFHSDAGMGNLQAALDEEGCYLVQIDGQDIDIGRLLNESTLGTTSATMTSEGIIDRETYQINSCEADLRIDDFQYQGYTYSPMVANATLSDDHLATKLSVSDPHIAAQVEGSCMLTVNSLRNIRFQAVVDSLDMHALHIIDTHPDTRFAFQISGNINDTDVDALAGSVALNGFTLTDSDHSWRLERLTLSAVPEPDRQTYTIISDCMNGALTGDFRLSTLAGTAYNLLERYEPTLTSSLLPELAAAGKQARNNIALERSNELTFTLNISDLSPLHELFDMPVALQAPANVNGCLFERNGILNIMADVPQLRLGDNHCRNLLFAVAGDNDSLKASVNGTLLYDEGKQLQIRTDITAEDDTGDISLSWNGAGGLPFTGQFAAGLSFSETAGNSLLTAINLHSSETSYDGSTWTFDPCHMLLMPDRYVVDGLHATCGHQFLSAEGAIATKNNIRYDIADSLSVHFNDIDIGNILDAIAFSPDLTFGGRASGSASLCNFVPGMPRVSAELDIDSLTFCDGPLGNAIVQVGCNADDIHFDVRAAESIVVDNSLPYTHVNGEMSMAKDSIDLTVDAGGTDMAFVGGLIPDVFDVVGGRAYGSLRIFGPLEALDMEGDLHAADASMHLPSTQVTYHFDDILHFRPGTIRFDNITVYDRDGRDALLDGYINHNHLDNWSYDLDIDAHGILGLDLPNSVGSSFYTTVYGDGTVHVYGADDLHVDIDARTCRGSLFALNLAGTTSTESGFITYRDRDRITAAEESRRNRMHSSDVARKYTVQPYARLRGKNMPEADEVFDCYIHVTARVTPDATIKLVLDPSTDDNVSAYGTGVLDIQLHNDDLSIKGPYTLSHGSYHLNVQDLLHKDFEIVDGSTVTFDGDPMAARLDVTAQYTVGSVPLSDLTSDAASMDNVRVNCLLGIGGTPSEPQLHFGLDLPQGTEEQKSILRTYTATEEQMNLQFVYLLGLGKFYTYDYGQTTSGTQGGYSAMTSLVNSTISGQLNAIISDLLANDNWTLSGNIRSDNILGTYSDESLAGNMEVLGMLEGHMLDNRLLVNGNFGYRDNPMYASNFIGDFDIRYLIIPRQSLWIKGYNKTNDRYFSRTALTTQGIGLMFNKDFDSLWKKKKDTFVTDNDTIQ